jgi:hypothetical protein
MAHEAFYSIMHEISSKQTKENTWRVSRTRNVVIEWGGLR